MNRIDLSTPSDVITICDYETCPTIKSGNDLSTVIVVKSNENLHSVEAGINHGDDNHCEPRENRAVRGAHQ
jgi:hypothetical protein